MELKTFLKILKQNFKFIILVSFLTSGLFTAVYFLVPESFTAEGTIYAYPVGNSNQKSEVSNELNYSRNLIALSNSPEFKRLIKGKGLTDMSFTPLVGIVGSLKLKEVSPNILSLSVVGQSENQVKGRYKDYLNSIDDFSQVLKKGNSSFELSFLSEEPIISRSSKNYFQFLMLGFISGLFLSSFYLFIKKK